MENLILLLFACLLLACLYMGWSILIALLLGLFLFSAYALRQGFSAGQVLRMWWNGILTARNVLLTFCFIGFLTGLWRACGTIPAIVYYASGLIRPSVIVLLTFLLNCLLSFLMGTSFGTAATMGLICMTMANLMGVSKALIGGAVLSGIYFGDRASPVSTSALLTAEITGTDLYDNIRRMLRSSLVPFLLATVCYYFMGAGVSSASRPVGVQELFARSFDVSWPMLVPAGVILLLAAFRVPVRKTLSVSIVLSIFCAAVFQKLGGMEILRTMVLGFRTDVPELRNMLSGGGLVSMFRTGAIVGVGSCYSGIFEKTGLLRNLQGFFEKVARRTSPAAGVLGASILSAMIACNQTLAIMMTRSICSRFGMTPEKLALTLEDTVVVVSGLVLWNIACAAPLAFIGAPDSSVGYAFYLYFLPLCCLLGDGFRGRKS
jgi:NhaC family Na+:H+ antiporter